MAPAIYLALFLVFFPTVILAEPRHVPLTRWRKKGWNRTLAANNIRQRYSHRSSSPQNHRRAESVTEPLQVQGLDTSYIGEIDVGSPPQQYDVVLDTGSSDLWFLSANCNQCPSSASPFDTKTSSTFETITSSPPVDILYGSGKVAGIVGQDTVSMANFTVENQTFLSVTSMTNGILEGNVTGLLGIAFPSLASTNATPFLLAVANSDQFTEPEMSFFFERQQDRDASDSTLSPGGVLTLGGTNSAFFSGPIEFIVLLEADSYWLLPVIDLFVNGVRVTLSIAKAPAAIDSGTTLVGGPRKDIEGVYNAIQGSRPSQNDQFFEFPCSANVTVAFGFGGKIWPISPQDFNIGEVNNSSDTEPFCEGAFFVLDQSSDVGSDSSGPGITSPPWVIGDTFLKNVYSVFRISPASVGFAELSTAAGGSGTAPAVSSPSIKSAAMSTSIPAFLMLSTAFTIMLCL